MTLKSMACCRVSGLQWAKKTVPVTGYFTSSSTLLS